jgi:hypothetical protein
VSSFRNNQLNMVSLFDPEPTNQPAEQPDTMFCGIFDCFRGRDGYERIDDDKYGNMDDDKGYATMNDHKGYGTMDDVKANPAPHKEVKVKDERDGEVSHTPSFSSEDGESDFGSRRSSRIPSRTPKINKDGAPRKPRQPRPKLLKWSDNDWKNVVLGIIWACGETGVQIPFDQAAQVVGDNCTAGAMQQAILKLRQKQVDAGYQIPPLRMAWTRKNRNSSSSLSSANSKIAQASPSPNVAKKDAGRSSRRSRIVKLKIKRSSKVESNDQEPLLAADPAPYTSYTEETDPYPVAEPNGYPLNTVPGPPAPINDHAYMTSGLFLNMPGEGPTDGLMHRNALQEAQVQGVQRLNYSAYMAPDSFTTGLEDMFGEVEDYGFEFP